MKYSILISYFVVAVMAIMYLGQSEYKVVSMCCESDYRNVIKSKGEKIHEKPYCLSCKKWCELIEVKETQ